VNLILVGVKIALYTHYWLGLMLFLMFVGAVQKRFNLKLIPL